MPSMTRTCKICGKVYQCCRTERPDTIFRWQDVACSPEHGAMYFAAIMKSRGEELPEDIQALLPETENGAQEEARAEAPKRSRKKAKAE